MAIADPPAETIAALSLDALAAAINDDHEAVEHMARSTLDRARAAGDKLIQAKSQVPHGEWLPWLAANCPRLATRTAQTYMKLAREWDTLVLKNADSAHLTVDGALKLLAAPAEPEWAKGLTPDEKAELDRIAANIKASWRKATQCLDDMGGYLRAMRDGNGWKALGFVSMEAFADFSFGLDVEMLGYLLDPPSPWLEATDAMQTAHVRWMLRQQGLSDTDARALMAQWDAEQAELGCWECSTPAELGAFAGEWPILVSDNPFVHVFEIDEQGHIQGAVA